MITFFYTFLVVFTFLAMEGVAWFTHKYIMHGFLWSWHKDHHKPYDGFFEKNDLFALVFSLPAMLSIMVGLQFQNQGFLWLFFIGIGITAYGIFYVIFHDIIVHRRIKIHYKAHSAYMKRLIRAHKIHHKKQGKEEGEAFGFLFAPKKYAVKQGITDLLDQ